MFGDDWRPYVIAFGPGIALGSGLLVLFWLGVL